MKQLPCSKHYVLG